MTDMPIDPKPTEATEVLVDQAQVAADVVADLRDQLTQAQVGADVAQALVDLAVGREDRYDTPETTAATCLMCGAFVYDLDLHDKFHGINDKLADRNLRFAARELTRPSNSPLNRPIISNDGGDSSPS